jgi:hypothetical protein
VRGFVGRRGKKNKGGGAGPAQPGARRGREGEVSPPACWHVGRSRAGSAPLHPTKAKLEDWPLNRAAGKAVPAGGGRLPRIFFFFPSPAAAALVSLNTTRGRASAAAWRPAGHSTHTNALSACLGSQTYRAALGRGGAAAAGREEVGRSA